MTCADEQTLIPQVEENIEEVRWFKIDDLEKVMANTYLSLREFLEKNLSII
jgi:hypothetical protein